MPFTITNSMSLAASCSIAFPSTALCCTIRVFDIEPADSAVLIYTPRTRDNAVQFNGPDATAEVPVDGHEMFAQPILGNKSYRVEFLGYRGDPTQ